MLSLRSFDMLRTDSAQTDNDLSYVTLSKAVTLSKFILSEVEVSKCSLSEVEVSKCSQSVKQ